VRDDHHRDNEFLFYIKNAVWAAHALAAQEGARVTIIDSGKEFEADSSGVGQSDNMPSYF